jgi:hypothetical protein
MKYTFYKPTGEITVIYSISPEELPLNMREGENYIEGEYSPLEYDIVNGVPVKHGRRAFWMAPTA